jgi:PAS domain S-box-containing protein
MDDRAEVGLADVSAAVLRDALAGSVGFVWATDADNRVTYLSDGVERITGLARTDLVGRRAQDLPLFRDSAAALEFRQTLFEARAPVRDSRLSIVNNRGELKLLSVSGSPRFGADGQFLGYAGVAIDVTESAQPEASLAKIAQAVSGATGADYFRTLVQTLAEVLDADRALIGRMVEGAEPSIATIAVHGRDGPAANFIYPVAGTPCAQVVGREICVHAAGAYRKFPLDGSLVDAQIEGYCGAPLLDSKGTPIGILAVMCRKPLSNADLARNILQMFAGRAAAELERRAIETALRDSEARYRAFYAETPTMLAARNDERKLVAASDQWLRFTGYTREELIGRDGLDLLTPASRDRFQRDVQPLLDAEGAAEYEVELRRKDGSVADMQVSTRAHRDPITGRRELLSVLTDQTARKQAEQALAQSRDYLLRSQQIGNTGYIVVDMRNRSSTWSDSMFAIRQVPRRDAPFDAVESVAFIHPDDRELFAKARDAAIASGQPYEIELRVVRSDGGIVWEHSIGEPLYGADGTIDRMLVFVQDVTQRRLTEDENRKLALVAAQTNNLVMITNATHDIEWVNEAFTRITGFSFAEAIGRKPRDLLMGGQKADPALVALTRGTLDRGEAFRDIEMRCFGHDGSPYWLRLEAQPVRDTDGRIVRHIGIGSEITAQKEAELALAEKERELRAILDNAPIAVFLKDRDGRYRIVNRRYEEWMMVRGSELYGRTDYENYSAELAAIFRQTDREVLEHGRTTLQERDTSRTRSDIERLLVTKFPIRDADGTVVGIGGFLVDITARHRAEQALRASEERFRALIEHSNDIVLIVDADGALRYHSPSAPLQLGFGTLDLLGGSILSLVHAEDAEGIHAALREIAATPSAQTSGEARVRQQDGSWHHLAWSARNAADVPGVEGIIVNARDVTEAKRLEEQLLQAQKMEAVGQLAGGIAHDFNNILGAILGFGTMLAEDLPQAAPQHGFARRIVSASERARDLVRQILAFSRPTGVEREAQDVGRVVRDTAELLRGSLPSSMDLKIEAESGLVAQLNAGQIGQVLLNLCLNAKDAAPGELGTITITVDAVVPRDRQARDSVVWSGAVDPAQRYVRLAVSDAGAGMPPDVLKRMFDPFFTTKPRGRGTGLGLAVVHGVLRNHDGACRVTSEPDAGTTIEIFLPRVDAPAVAATAAADKKALGGHERVLIVDDDPDMADMLTIGLGRLGYRTATCNDPRDAITLIERDPAAWDVVISDQVMPHVKGTTLLARVKALNPGLRFILCTGYSDGASEAVARQAGADGYFLKPVAPDVLAAAVRELVRPSPPIGGEGGAASAAPGEGHSGTDSPLTRPR